MVRLMAPVIKKVNAKAVLHNPQKLAGFNFFLVRLVMSPENKKGSMVNDMIKTHTIPRMEMAAIDLNAGCFARIKTPKPAMVVMADKKIEVLKEDRFFRPY